MDPSFSPLLWDRRLFRNILHCQNMGQEGEKLSSRWISAHSCPSPCLCRVLPGIYFSSILIDTPGSMYYQSHFAEMKRTRQNGEVMCPWPRGREAARQRPGHRSSDMCRIQASFFSFLAAFPVLWKESKPGRINNNNKSKINDRLFSICHVLDSILITSGTLLLPPFHNFWGLSSAFPLKEETGFQIG